MNSDRILEEIKNSIHLLDRNFTLPNDVALDRYRLSAEEGNVIGETEGHMMAYDLLGAKIGIISNVDRFVANSQLQSKFGIHHTRIIDFNSKELDAVCYIINADCEPDFRLHGNNFVAAGNFLELEQMYGTRHSIDRYLVYSFCLSSIERVCGIYNFHASALFDESAGRLLIFCGTQGSGKTSMVLAGIAEGLQPISNDLVSVKILGNGSYQVYVGSLDIPIYRKTLENFPELLSALPFLKANLNRDKIQVDLSKLQPDYNEISVQQTKIIFPQIIFSAPSRLVRLDNCPETHCRLYENLTERIRLISRVHYVLPVPSLDTQVLATKRSRFVDVFSQHIEHTGGLFFASGDPREVMKLILQQE